MKRIQLILFSILLLSSCYTEKKATFQITKAQSNYSIVVAEKCALWYPVKPYDSVFIRYIKGETEYYFDTLRVDCDSVLTNIVKSIGSKPNVVIKAVKVPKLRVDTFYDHQYHTVENTAKTEFLQSIISTTNNSLEVAKSNYVSEKENRFFWMKLAIILCCYLVLKTGLRLYFPNNNLLKKLP